MQTNKLEIVELNKQLQALIEKTYSLLETTNQNEIKEKLDEELSELRERIHLKIAFIGQYSAGKSTIISALTGNKEIKIDANVATDRVSEYRWNNLVLMDTPGILAGKTEHHDLQTKKALEESDLIIYVLTSQLFDDIIFDNFIDLAYTQKQDDKILIVINKMSMDAGDFETLKQNYTESIHTIFNERGYDFNFPIIFIDALDYIEGVESNDDEFIELSNFGSFTSTLNSFVQEKGLKKKQFDTPVRILKRCISDIAISQMDPNLKKQVESYAARINKSMRDMERSLRLELDRFESDSFSSIIDISSFIGEVDKDQFQNKLDTFKSDISDKTETMLSKIEDVVEMTYGELMSEIDDFGDKDVLVLHRKDLDAKINSPSISLEEKKNLEKQRLFLDYFLKGSEKLAVKSGVEAIKGVAQASGSQLHTTVYSVGKFFGHNFKPWGAVKIAGNIGKFAKFGVPAIGTVASIFMDLHAKKQEEKRAADIKVAKNQLSANFRSQIKSIRNEIENDINDNVISNYRSKLDELDRIKLDVSQTMTKNEILKKAILDLDSAYVDFIEVI